MWPPLLASVLAQAPPSGPASWCTPRDGWTYISFANAQLVRSNLDDYTCRNLLLLTQNSAALHLLFDGGSSRAPLLKEKNVDVLFGSACLARTTAIRNTRCGFGFARTTAIRNSLSAYCHC